ncbi:MAG TPA: phasin family protein [Myxococcales bacterium]|nr:phasin family protein [Myxococcales bacterium]
MSYIIGREESHMKLSEIVKTTFETLRTQLSGLEKRVETLEKKAQKSIVQVQSQLEGAAGQVQRAFAGLGKQLQGAVTFATRSEVQALAARIDELTEKVEKLARGERLRSATRKSEAA